MALVISCYRRPHIVSNDRECWCRPTVDGDHVMHNDVDLRLDPSGPKMACFSEQLPFVPHTH